MDADFPREAMAGLTDPKFYICGKPEMATFAVQTLDALGVPRASMVYEMFSGY